MSSTTSPRTFTTAYATPPDSRTTSRRGSVCAPTDSDTTMAYWDTLPEKPEDGIEALEGVVEAFEKIAAADALRLSQESRSRSRGRSSAQSAQASRNTSASPNRSTDYLFKSFADVDAAPTRPPLFGSSAASQVLREASAESEMDSPPYTPLASSSSNSSTSTSSSSTSISSMSSGSSCTWLSSPPASPGPEPANFATRTTKKAQGPLKPLTQLKATKSSLSLHSLRSKKSSMSLVTVAAGVGSHPSFGVPPPRLT